MSKAQEYLGTISARAEPVDATSNQDEMAEASPPMRKKFRVGLPGCYTHRLIAAGAAVNSTQSV